MKQSIVENDWVEENGKILNRNFNKSTENSSGVCSIYLLKVERTFIFPTPTKKTDDDMENAEVEKRGTVARESNQASKE